MPQITELIHGEEEFESRLSVFTAHCVPDRHTSSGQDREDSLHFSYYPHHEGYVQTKLI